VVEKEKEKLSRKKLKDKQFRNPEVIGNSEWDHRWIASNANQVVRYRNRLLHMHRKHKSGFSIEI
jgi:hypothetical protein